MDTPTAPARAPSPDGDASSSWVRWGALRADLLGLLVVGLVAAPVGAIVHAALYVEDADGFENLGVFIVAWIAGALVAAAAAGVLLVATARNASWVDRAAGHDHDGGPREAAARFGRWLLVAVAAPAVVNGATPGWVRDVPSIVAAAVACVVAVVALAWVYTDRTHPRQPHRMAVAVVVGVLVATVGASATLARPLRPAQVADRVESALPTLLEQAGATRVCAARGVVAGEAASHATEPCYDPDQVWAGPDDLDTTTDRLVELVAQVVPAGTGVRAVEAVTHVGPARQVVLSNPGQGAARTVLFVARTECGTRVRTGRSGSHPLLVDRFLPDLVLDRGCV